jgi:hypothetical protein
MANAHDIFANNIHSLMNKKLSFYVTGLALAGSILARSNASADEPPRPMPETVLLDEKPGIENSPTSKILKYGTAYTKDGNVPIPKKFLIIRNNSKDTVYPIMRDQNPNSVVDSGGNPIKPLVGIYDPFDTPKNEYRGYIGYQGDDKKFYYGLKPNTAIKVQVPVVFWDAARMGIETAGEYLLHDETKKPNPLFNDSKAARSITKSETGDGVIGNGVVMWYSSTTPVLAVAPADDTEDQLIEWTIRDHAFFTNPVVQKLTQGQIPSNQLLNLINYDVSNVDSLYLPVAMEVIDGWVTPQIAGDAKGKGWKAGSTEKPLGWTGSIKGDDFLQPHLRNFTKGDEKSPNALLGKYFGGKGWPYYNFPGASPDSDKVKLKIPSGANLFPQSPILNVNSSYYDDVHWQTAKFMLSSNGTEAVKVDIGNSINVSEKDSETLALNQSDDRNKMLNIKVNDRVIGLPSPDKKGPNPIPKDTWVTEVNTDDWTVKLNNKLANDSSQTTFTFTRPVHDYAAEALIRLWFAWADYYTANWKKGNPNATDSPKTVKGTIQPMAASLVLESTGPTDKPADRLGLVEGMSVKGPGLDDAMTEVGIHQGDAVILEITNDKKTLILSQVATNSATPNASYTFTPPGKAPKDLMWKPKKAGDPGYNATPLDLVFDPSKTDPSRDPYEFSKQVYLIMASMNQIGQPNNNNVMKYMQDIIGANMGFIFNKKAQVSDDGKLVTSMIRDKIKSVLRGVSDFTKFPDKMEKGEHVDWYPNPAAIKAHGYVGKQEFNVFNLDPYVWFVHDILKFSGYGFSVDDDTSDVGADGGTTIVVTVTGSTGLPNTAMWTAQAPFGPIPNFPCVYSGPPAPNKGITQYHDVLDASNTSPIRITTSLQLIHQLAEGDKVVLDQIQGNNAANTATDSGTNQDPSKVLVVKNVGKNTFDLYHQDGTPTQGSGLYAKGTGRWGTYPFRAYLDTGSDLTKVYERVIGDDAAGTFLGTCVTVNGVSANPKTGEKFRVWQRENRSKGRLLLNIPLTDQSGNPLPANSNLNVTFSGDVH